MALAPTLQDLLYNLGERLGEVALATPTAGSTTTLTDAQLLQYWPQTVTQLHAWVYGRQDVVTSNRGVERRASAWNATTAQLTFPAAWPAAIGSTGIYEIHTRTARAQKKKALNEAIGELHLHWYRALVDESIVTTAETWRYTLPASVLWAAIPRVHVQISTTHATYPYVDATPWNWTIYRTTSASGDTTWYLQFGVQPPVGRTLRLFGVAAYADLVADTDILPLQEDWASMAQAWVLDYAQYLLWSWELNRQPAGQTERLRIQRQEQLLIAKEAVESKRPTRPNNRVVIPGHGDGQPWPVHDARYLAAWHIGAGV